MRKSEGNTKRKIQGNLGKMRKILIRFGLSMKETRGE